MQRLPFALLQVSIAVVALASDVRAQGGSVWRVRAHPRIAGGQGGFTGTLANDDEFGNSVAVLGDVDGDGTGDVAVGAWQRAAQDRGAAFVLLMRPDGKVASTHEIGPSTGDFTGTLDANDHFGTSVAGLGDLDGDGVPDLAVGAQNDDDGGSDRGAVWVLFLQADGSVRAHQKISATSGGFGGALANVDRFGSALAAPGDLDGDGIPDLFVGAPLADDGGVDRGAVWRLLLNADGTVKAQQEISATAGGFVGPLHDGDRFGSALSALGDFDGDGLGDLAAGARLDDDAGLDAGALWLLFLAADGTVRGQEKIVSPLREFQDDFFGSAVTVLDDLDGNGTVDLAVGAPGLDSSATGALALLFLESDGSVRRVVRIGDWASCGWSGALGLARFGEALATTKDVDGDGLHEFLVGAPSNDSAGTDRGAIYTVFLGNRRSLPGREFRKISAEAGGFDGSLADGDAFGSSTCALGDLDGDGHEDFAVGAPGTGTERGAVWILFANAERSVRASQEIGAGTGGFGGLLADYDRFGASVAGPGDLDGDGVDDLLVGAPGPYDWGPGNQTPRAGAVWVLFLNPDGTVKNEQEIGAGQGGFPGLLYDFDRFGSALTVLGDVNQDGVVDLAVGAPGDDDYDSFQNCFNFCCDTVGSVWILFLRADGTVSGAREISAASSDFPFHLDVDDEFGTSVAALGDLDGDGTVDLAAGGPFTDCQDFGEYGAVYVLFLAPDGSVRDARRLTEGESGVEGLAQLPYFGLSLSGVGDLDGDGATELAAGVDDPDGGCASVGAVWILHMLPDGTVSGMGKIGATSGGFAGELDDADFFGNALGAMPDFDRDGAPELLVGAPGDDDAGPRRGALWWLELGGLGHTRPRSSPPVPAVALPAPGGPRPLPAFDPRTVPGRRANLRQRRTP